jgi:hypothetical protein
VLTVRHVKMAHTAGVNTLDSTSIHLLQEVAQEYKTKHIRFLWANVKGSVRDTMNASGISLPPHCSRPHLFVVAHVVRVCVCERACVCV